MAEGAAGEEADRESGRCRRRAGKRLNKISDKMADSADTQKKSDDFFLRVCSFPELVVREMVCILSEILLKPLIPPSLMHRPLPLSASSPAGRIKSEVKIPPPLEGFRRELRIDTMWGALI